MEYLHLSTSPLPLLPLPTPTPPRNTQFSGGPPAVPVEPACSEEMQ